MMRLTGLIAAAFTPMTDDGDLDLGRVPAITDYVINQGARGLFLCGSTGESPSLSVAERKETASAYMLANRGRVPLIVHVGHNSLDEACDLAAHAEGLGAEAIAVVPPSYFQLSSVSEIVDCIAKISAAARSSSVYYYHIPRLTGVGIRMHHLLQRAPSDLPMLAGIKFSSFEFDDLIRCVHESDRHYNILFGSDEMLLAGLSMGVDGAVGSTFNFMADKHNDVIQAYTNGDMTLAQKCQLRSTEIIHTILQFGGHNAIKATMNLIGEDCGPPRLPIRPLRPSRCEDLGTALKREGL